MKNLKNLFSLFAVILFAASIAAAQIKIPVPRQTPNPAPKPKDPAASTSAALPKADDLIDKFIAVAGDASYKQLNSYYMHGKMEIPAMGIKGTFEEYRKAPNKNAVVMKMPGVGDFIEVYDGVKAWAADPINGVREKSGEELDQVRRNSDLYRYARLKEQFPKRETKGVEKVDGADAYVVVMTGDTTETYYFDQKTNYLVRIDQTVVAPQGKAPSHTFLSDYRKVKGMMIPFTIRSEVPPMSILLKVEEVKTNVPIDNAKFAKPEN